MTLQVKKDGKVVRDTTFEFKDADRADHAIQVMEILSGDPGALHGDSMVWIEEDGDEEQHVKIIKKKMKVVEEDGEEKEAGEKKRIKVIVSEDEKGSWHVIEEREEGIDEEVYMFEGDDVEVELEEILEEGEGGEEVKVIVVRKHKKDTKENKQ